MRVAVINRDKCNPKKCNFECNSYCPPVRSGKTDTVTISPVYAKAVIDESLCIGCGICVKRCPFGAIEVINLPEMKGTPVHQYGQNSFRVFNLPILRKGEVTGLLGPNGIGKTTILKILSNQLKPNLARQASEDDVIKSFKGSEVQKYFTQLYSGKVKISFKPQYVDDIPKVFKGKVKDLLSKVDESNSINSVCDSLGIEGILENDVSELSGGELQKVAIAAALLKQADYYFFDEPMSYLDVGERLKVARIIRDLADSGKGVLVIEHDLVSLDYLIDYLHVLYGRKSVYGVVSKPIKAKDGINSYLKGFLREENLRFRDSEIKFAERKVLKKVFQGKLFEWNALSKKFKNFELSVNPGFVKSEEIVGVLGPNATGKTTFMNLIAGVVKPSFGDVSWKLSVSYKPQYLAQSSESVLEFLRKNADLSSDEFLSAKKKLALDDLMLKKISELSGGELQLINIAACVSKKADVYLLDEPSAYLDVEQRVNVSRLIQDVLKLNGKTAVIIDHDLLFLSYVSDSVIVFSGTPSVAASSLGPVNVEDGMNSFLKTVGITFRKDPETNRPRANKLGSVKDREQKRKGEYFAP